MDRNEILLKLGNGTATLKEQEDFSLWVKSLSDRDYNQLLLQYETVMLQQKVNLPFDELLLKNIHQQINKEEEAEPSKLVSLKKSNKSWWYVAAAAVIVMGVFTLYKFSIQNIKIENSIVKNAVPKNDVSPGGNRAILQLADGSTIFLDSSHNGNIASQGQTKIIKIDGQLAYNADGSSKEILYNTISTPRGGQYQLILADGTKVWLNAASSLHFPTNFTGTERKVTLTGEGYFEVAKNEAMPFKVDVAGKGEVEVLGTHFNVNAYADEANIKTTLLEGSVRVTEPTTQLSKVILPSQQAQFNNSGKIIIKDDIDIDGVMAWKNGIFNFNNANLQEVLKQLSRWYDVDVVVEGHLPNRIFAGEMQRNLNLSQVIELLEKNRVKFKIDGKKLIVLK